FIWRSGTVLVSSIRRSDSVVLPWSTWAMTQKFRMRCWGSLTRPAYRQKPPRLLHISFTGRGESGHVSRERTQMTTTTMAPRATGTMKALVQEGDVSADVLHIRDDPTPEPAADRVL